MSGRQSKTGPEFAGAGGGALGPALEAGWGAEAQPHTQAVQTTHAAARAPILRCV
jgi:hypothetical protein